MPVPVRRLTLVLLVLAGALTGAAALPQVAAGALLQPARRPMAAPVPRGCETITLPGAGIDLKAWSCRAVERRGTIVFLHGVADNRSSAAGVAPRFTARGFDVVAYDSRAHGESGGEFCTYGYHEKADLRRVLDRLRAPIAVVGTSLGGAVALQAAADDPRIRAVVAAETFSDLRTVVLDRVPRPVPTFAIGRAISAAEARGAFAVDDVSPADAARRIRVPVLLIHGAEDTDTVPDHSRRIFENLRGPKRLVLVDGARHNESLSSTRIWDEIQTWIDGALMPGR